MTIPVSHVSPLGELEGVRHGFFGREGGVSTGIYSSLNVGPFSDDRSADVERNRELVADCLSARALVTNKQVHGAGVRVIDSQSDLSRHKEADGLVTMERGIALGALGADCAPVLFVDADKGVIGAAHAGWQGAVAGVTDAVVETMCERGAGLSGIVAAIGPAIHKQSYEVGDAFRDKVIAMSPVDASSFFHHHSQSGNVHFDLAGYIKCRLQAAGVESVALLDVDTYSEEQRFFSYRRTCHHGEADYGRQVGAICLV